MIIEIILVVVGIGLIIAGYLIPAKKDENEGYAQISRDEIESMVSEEVEQAKGRIDDIVDETINYAIEKTERSMDRLSNEKMMAVSEYSDTVLDQINKNHEEVVFLYDMLNDKHENLKETVAEAARTVNDVKESIKEAQTTKDDVVKNAQEAAKASEPAPEPAPVKEPAPSGESRKRNKPVPVIKNETIVSPFIGEEPEEDEESEDDYYEEDWENAEDPDDNDGPEISFNAHSPGSRNSNDRILELHKAGKSNMAIAKELGLGIGEVKLVIDLFKGQ